MNDKEYFQNTKKILFEIGKYNQVKLLESCYEIKLREGVEDGTNFDLKESLDDILEIYVLCYKQGDFIDNDYDLIGYFESWVQQSIFHNDPFVFMSKFLEALYKTMQTKYFERTQRLDNYPVMSFFDLEKDIKKNQQFFKNLNPNQKDAFEFLINDYYNLSKNYESERNYYQKIIKYYIDFEEVMDEEI